MIVNLGTIVENLSQNVEDNFVDVELFNNFLLQNQHMLNKLNYKKKGIGWLSRRFYKKPKKPPSPYTSPEV